MVITCDTTLSRGARILALDWCCRVQPGGGGRSRERKWRRMRGRGWKKKKKCPDAYELTNVCFGCWEWSSIVGLKKHQNTIQGWHPVGRGERGGGGGGWRLTQAASTALRLSCRLSEAFAERSARRDREQPRNKHSAEMKNLLNVFIFLFLAGKSCKSPVGWWGGGGNSFCCCFEGNWKLWLQSGFWSLIKCVLLSP